VPGHAGPDGPIPFNESEALLVNGRLMELKGLRELMEEVRRLSCQTRGVAGILMAQVNKPNAVQAGALSGRP